MDIDLSKLDQLGLDPSFQTKILEQDRTQDQQLTEDDFKVRFGDEATQEYYPEIESSIQKKNPKEFVRALQRLAYMKENFPLQVKK